MAKKKKAKRKTTRSRKNKGTSAILKKFLLNTKCMPIAVVLLTLSFLFIVFRMKNVEKDMEISRTNKKIERIILESKEIKAQKADLLSVENLKRLAKKYKLKSPKRDQIIVVP